MAKKWKKTTKQEIEQEVIEPTAQWTFWSRMEQIKGWSLADTLWLVIWAIAVIIGLIMLAELAIGIILVLLWSVWVNNRLTKYKR